MPRVAVAQAPGVRLDRWRGTLDLLSRLVRRAAAQRAELVVLPECAWPAYHIGSRRAYFDARAGGLPDHRHLLDRLARWARAGRVMICAGYIEQAGRRLFNSACLFSAAGELLGTHRKCFLWDFDHDWFEPGELIRPLDSDLGRVGVMICADARLPEIPATLVARGASLIAQPTAWVDVGGAGRVWNPQPDFMIRARAREFGVPIASASKWGSEHGTTFVGSSLICDARGEVLARCGCRETAVRTAEVGLARPRPAAIAAETRATLLAATAFALRIVVYPPAALPGPGALRALAQQEDAPLLVVAAGGRLPAVGEAARTAGAGLALLRRPPRRAKSLQGVCIWGVTDEQARSFAPVRAAALRGAHLVVVFGDRIDQAVIRTRALENRVFVALAGRNGAALYDPAGARLAACSWGPSTRGGAGARPLSATLDVWQAADKWVARRTNVLAGRVPCQYAL